MSEPSFPPFAVTVDLVAFAPLDGEDHVLVVRRGGPPFEGEWALPGGFVELDEDLPDAAVRELVEETGVEVAVSEVEQLAAYGAPGRDPRSRTVTVVYLAVLAEAPAARGGDDASHAQWRPIGEVQAAGLAFDHAQILHDALARSGHGSTRR